MGCAYFQICDPHRIKKLAADRKSKDPNSPGCVVYSIGSSGSFIFEMGMQKEVGEGVCEYHIFDFGDYEKSVPKDLGRVHYHKWGLQKQESDNNSKPIPGKSFYSLQDTIKLLGHEQFDVIDVFKIDCEHIPLHCVYFNCITYYFMIMTYSEMPFIGLS